jgi:ABC-type molybdate transport system permease subunit
MLNESYGGQEINLIKFWLDSVGSSTTALACAVLLSLIVFFLVAGFASYKSDSGKSMLGLFARQLLTLIPVVSVVMLFIWSFGKRSKEDPTFRNIARLYLTFKLTYLVFIISFFAFDMLLFFNQ